MQDAVGAHAHVKYQFLRLDVDVRGALVHGLGEDVVHQFDDRRLLGQFAQVADIIIQIAGGAAAPGHLQQPIQVLGACQAPLPAVVGQTVVQRFVDQRVQRVTRHRQHLPIRRRPGGHAVVQPPFDVETAAGQQVADGVGLFGPFAAGQQRYRELVGQDRQQGFLRQRTQPHQDAADAAAELFLEGQRLLDVGSGHDPAIDQQFTEQARARRPAGRVECAQEGRWHGWFYRNRWAVTIRDAAGS